VGSRHSSVKTIQVALAKVLKKKITATGVYTASTQSDVRLFQTSVGMKPTGNVSGNTWMVLMPTAALVQTG
ncbi:MAG: peptidoglycan-binding protein, partial [Ilumatobacteraceae bacterium]|nr:peptidoglycan-binding protein [Ilumatobacteraceae bacterium]